MKKHYNVSGGDDLLNFLCKNVCAVPKSRIRIQIKRGEVKVNGTKVTSNIKLSAGDSVEIFLPEKFAAGKIDILYSDDNVIVVDKPPFTESEIQLPALIREQYGIDTFAVHRLDTNTTGVIILAKTASVKQMFIDEFRRGNVKKTYRAQVFGCPSQDEGRLIAYLVKNAEDSFCKINKTPVAESKEIITDYKVVRRGEVSVLELSPVTGRTHQLRAHMAHIGCPIVGDDKYGDRRLNLSAGAKIQRLRAVSIMFENMCASLDYLNGKTISASIGQDYI